jgi:hypothetical protein
VNLSFSLIPQLCNRQSLIVVITPIPGNKSGKHETSNDCTVMCIDTLKGMFYLRLRINWRSNTCNLTMSRLTLCLKCCRSRSECPVLLSSPCGLFVITRRSYKFCLLATVLLLSSCYDLSKLSRGFTSLLTSSLLLCILPEQISVQSNSNGKRMEDYLQAACN